MMDSMTEVTTATQAIDALGGTMAVSRLTGRRPQNVTNWRTDGKMPAATFLKMTRALSERGIIAPASLWGIEEPEVRLVPDAKPSETESRDA
jgi:hypothetical protein